MKILHIFIFIIFLLNIGFTPTVNAEDQNCAMHHQQMNNMDNALTTVDIAQSHSCCDEVVQEMQSCPEDCGHCQSHCSGMAMLPVIAAPDLDVMNQSSDNHYRNVYYNEPTEGWLIPPIFHS